MDGQQKELQPMPQSQHDYAMVDPDHPSKKRRKHFGVRYGEAPLTSQQTRSNRIQDQGPQQQRPSTNHHHVERAKAEAQLRGRKFLLDTRSCTLPSQDQLFISHPWALPDMMAEKKKLNDTKNLLDCKDIK